MTNGNESIIFMTVYRGMAPQLQMTAFATLIFILQNHNSTYNSIIFMFYVRRHVAGLSLCKFSTPFQFYWWKKKDFFHCKKSYKKPLLDSWKSS